MGTEKRERQKAGRAARVEAAEAAQKKAESRRRIAWVVGTVAFVAAVLFVVSLVRGDDDKTDAASSTNSGVSTSTTVAAASVTGEPCVAVSEPLPPGAPEVPVAIGPPPTELVIQDLVEGTGEEVLAGATVTAAYTGVSCSTGAIFDSSYENGGQPVEFPLTQVIPGWQQGIPGMKVGGQRLLGVPSEMAYGASPNRPAKVAPGETLWFVVDVTAVDNAAASPG